MPACLRALLDSNQGRRAERRPGHLARGPEVPGPLGRRLPSRASFRMAPLRCATALVHMHMRNAALLLIYNCKEAARTGTTHLHVHAMCTAIQPSGTSTGIACVACICPWAVAQLNSQLILPVVRVGLKCRGGGGGPSVAQWAQGNPGPAHLD